MDYKKEWDALRDELYATIKATRYPDAENNQAYANTLCRMLDAEDKDAGVDVDARHNRELYSADITAIYESRDRS